MAFEVGQQKGCLMEVPSVPQFCSGVGIPGEGPSLYWFPGLGPLDPGESSCQPVNRRSLHGISGAAVAWDFMSPLGSGTTG